MRNFPTTPRETVEHLEKQPESRIKRMIVVVDPDHGSVFAQELNDDATGTVGLRQKLWGEGSDAIKQLFRRR